MSIANHQFWVNYFPIFLIFCQEPEIFSMSFEQAMRLWITRVRAHKV